MPKAPFSLPLCCVLLTYLLAAGCAAEDEGAAPAEDFPPLVLQEVERIAEPLFGSIAGIAVARDGRVFVGDGQALAIAVFGADGQLLRTIGTGGQGPGEFQSLSDLRVIGNGLYAHDIQARRTTYWPLDDLEQPKLLPPGEEGSRKKLIGRRGDMSLWVEDPVAVIRSVAQADMQEQGYVSLLREGVRSLDSLMAMPATDMFIVMTDDGVIFHSLPYFRDTFFDFHDGLLYKHWSGEARVELFDMEMTPVGEVGIDFDGKTLTSTERDELINQEWPNEAMRSTYRQVLRERIPDRWPATDHVFVDTDGRIWMGLNRRSLDETRWIVFDEERDPLGRIDLPNTIQLRAATGERVYGWLNDDEVGGPVVVRYVLDVPEG